MPIPSDCSRHTKATYMQTVPQEGSLTLARAHQSVFAVPSVWLGGGTSFQVRNKKQKQS